MFGFFCTLSYIGVKLFAKSLDFFANEDFLYRYLTPYLIQDLNWVIPVTYTSFSVFSLRPFTFGAIAFFFSLLPSLLLIGNLEEVEKFYFEDQV